MLVAAWLLLSRTFLPPIQSHVNQTNLPADSLSDSCQHEPLPTVSRPSPQLPCTPARCPWSYRGAAEKRQIRLPFVWAWNLSLRLDHWDYSITTTTSNEAPNLRGLSGRTPSTHCVLPCLVLHCWPVSPATPHGAIRTRPLLSSRSALSEVISRSDTV